MNASELNAYLRERIEEVGHCWEWQRALQGRYRMPVMNFGGSVVSVRRHVARTLGLYVPEHSVVTTSCGNPLCVNPRHVMVTSRAELQARTGAAAASSLKQLLAHKMALRSRGQVRLSAEQVAEIRAAEGISQRELAALYGVSQATVSAIRRGRTWKDHSNPWVRMLTAP
jgi:DNA-binding transcriptional regulator YiaG